MEQVREAGDMRKRKVRVCRIDVSIETIVGSIVNMI